MKREKSLSLAILLATTSFTTAAQAQSSASSFTWATRYDLDRRITGTIAPDPDGADPLKHAAVRNTFNPQGWLTKVETGELSAWQSESVAPASWTGFTIFRTVDYTYDVSGRKTKETVSGGGVVKTVAQFSYDGADKPVCSAVRMNEAVFGSLPSDACSLGTQGSWGPDRITKTVYNGSGQVDYIQKGYGTSLQQIYVSYTYTPNGKVATVTDANVASAQFLYDGLDRKSRWYFPSKTTAGAPSTNDYEEYTYDAAGNRTKLQKRDGQAIQYTYDQLNRVTLKDIPGSTAQDVYYGYDNRGVQTYARFASASGEGVSSSYDNLGRQTSTTVNMDGVIRTVGHTFDADGSRVTVTHPDGNYFGYSYDLMDRLVRVRENATGGASANFLGSNYFNAQGLLDSTLRGSSEPVIYTAYSYDAVQRRSQIFDNMPNGAADDLTSVFMYSPASQIAGRTRDNDTFVFGQEANAARTYTVNGLNQYQVAGTASFLYDANGNLTSDGSVAFTYDVENRLVGASGGKSAGLRYDPLGRLYESNNGTGGGVTRFLYDGDELIAEYDSAGNLLRRYVHQNGADDPLVWYEGSAVTPSARRLIQTDQVGSVVSVSDYTATSITKNTYDDWGIPASTNIGRFQYTGQAWIPELGMYHYKARVYSPTLGRFLQTDPVGYQDQANLYSYVNNDPINSNDPTGTETRDYRADFFKCGTEKASASCTSANATPSQPDNGGKSPQRYTITIATDLRGRSALSGPGQGHSWIILTKSVDGKTYVTTFGLFADAFAKPNGPGNDIRNNEEIGRPSTASKTAEISERTFNAIIRDSQRDITYSAYSNNCVDFSTREWQIGTGQKIAAQTFYGVSTPYLLEQELRK